MFRRHKNSFRGIFDVEKFPGRLACAPALDEGVAPQASVDTFLYERRNHVRTLRIEIISWAVEVYRQQINSIQPVFLSVGQTLDQKDLFSDAVRRVGFLRIAI